MSDIDRELPNDQEAERLVLASVLLDDKAVHTVVDQLRRDEFYLEAHRIVFDSIISLSKESAPIDPFTLKSELSRVQKLDQIGGLPFLMGLTDGVPRATNLKHYCKIVRDRATSRSLIAMGNRLMTEAWQGGEPPKKLLERIQSEMLEMYGRNDDAGPQHISNVVSSGFRDLETRRDNRERAVVMTGFIDIDGSTGGLRKDNLVILAARPSQGKSALAVNIAINAAKKSQKKVLIFSLEMSQTEIYDRMLSSEGNLNCASIVRGYISRQDWMKIGSVSGKLSELPVWIDDSGSVSMLQIRSRAMKLAAEVNGLDLIVIDYLQLIQGSGRSIYERVTEVSRELKILAKDLHVPIMALSQLHRLQDENGEPKLSDLKESGAIEQDSDMVFFLWPSKIHGIKQFKIGKQRNGPLRIFNLGWEPNETRFYDCTTVDRMNDEPGIYQAVAEDSR